MRVVAAASLACALLAAAPTDAHVRMFLDSEAPLAIRNARNANEDGRFSTSGPCGGAAAFGANTANIVKDGQNVCARINYNGGHKSAKNAFTAKFSCGAPSEATMKAGEVLTTGEGSSQVGVTSIPAPTGNSVAEGYKFCVTLPAQNLAANVADDAAERKCTLSVQDQRAWGSCIDFQLASDPPPPPPPPAPNTTPVKDVAGVYVASACDANCEDKCPQGHVAVKEDGTVVTKISTWPTIGRGSIDRDRLPGTFVGAVDISVNKTYAQPFEVKVVGTNILLANSGLDEPIVCDNRAAFAMSLEDALAANVFTAAELSGDVVTAPGPDTPGPDAPGPVTPGTTAPQPRAGEGEGFTMYYAMGGVAAAGAAGLVIVKSRSYKNQQADRTSQYGVGNMPSPKAFTQGAEWRAVADPTSGRTYYYNTLTQETSWTQPHGMTEL
jgi:hypothetical protein